MERVEPANCLTSWNPDGLARLASHLAEAEGSGRSCVLDLSDEAIAGSSRPAAVRLDIPSVMVAANLLVGRFRDLPIKVRLPESPGLSIQLARGGFFFALANRCRTMTWADGEPEEWVDVAKAWTHPFHPSDADMCREALVRVRDPKREAWVVRAAFQRYLLSVIHPHMRPAQNLRWDLNHVAQRWLSTRLDIKQGSELVDTLMDCAAIFHEIAVNIPDHAGLGSGPTGASLGQIYVTLGGGRESYNRLHISVMDNGIGIARRVSEKFTDRPRSSEEALQDAVLGKLPRREAGRGVGLSLVREIASEYAGGERNVGGPSNIRIITSGEQPQSASELDWSSEADPATSAIENVPVQGTLVWVCLGLERRTPADDDNQLELTFAEPISG